MTVPPKIQRLLDGGQLQTVEVSNADVSALWQKAVTSARDSGNEDNSPDNQYVLGYQAPLQTATAILAAAGYRTRGAQGHHANAFYALAALAIEGLVDIDIRTERIRQMRKLSDLLEQRLFYVAVDQVRLVAEATRMRALRFESVQLRRHPYWYPDAPETGRPSAGHDPWARLPRKFPYAREPPEQASGWTTYAPSFFSTFPTAF